MMQGNPHLLLFGLAAAIWLGAQSWHRRQVKRAARDLPTALRRRLGPEPGLLPPADLPAGLVGYARLHRRTARIQRGIRGLALLWLAFVLFLVLRKQFL